MVCYGKQVRKHKRYLLEDLMLRYLHLDFRSVNVSNSGNHGYQDVTCHLPLLALC